MKYLNQWKLKPQDTNPTGLKLSTINVAADKIFYNHYYAPYIRKFILLHNTMFDSLKKSFLPYFYSEYLLQYFFADQKKVTEVVFQKIGISEEVGKSIY